MRQHVRTVAAAVTSIVGAEELVLIAALVLIVLGLWPMVGIRALIVPGVALLWIALPARAPLIWRVPPKPEKPMRRTG